MNKSDIRRLSDACRSIIKEYGVVRDSCVQNRLNEFQTADKLQGYSCLLYTSPSPRDRTRSRMPSSA